MILLTDDQVSQVKQAADNDRNDPHGSALLALWRIIEPDYDDKESVDPTQYVMSRGQLSGIIEHCLKYSHTGMGEAMFMWMNVGPSSR